MAWPPTYKRPKPEDNPTLQEDLVFDEAHKRAPAKRRKRQLESTSEPVFDVKRWRVPPRWRNDKRVGDVAMSKMLRGVDLSRYECLADGEGVRLDLYVMGAKS